PVCPGRSPARGRRPAAGRPASRGADRRGPSILVRGTRNSALPAPAALASRRTRARGRSLGPPRARTGPGQDKRGRRGGGREASWGEPSPWRGAWAGRNDYTTFKGGCPTGTPANE